jgi:hypothetical protein
MNPYVLDACCDVCGGPGVATVSAAADQWMGAKIRHTDPEICAAYLRRKKQELDKREATLKAEKGLE